MVQQHKWYLFRRHFIQWTLVMGAWTGQRDIIMNHVSVVFRRHAGGCFETAVLLEPWADKMDRVGQATRGAFPSQAMATNPHEA